MDYKIYNIELVNRLSAWQHTAFKTKTSIPIPFQAESGSLRPKRASLRLINRSLLIHSMLSHGMQRILCFATKSAALFVVSQPVAAARLPV